MAGLEYLYLLDSPHELDNLTSKISSTGALPCFCDLEAETGKPNDYMYDLQYKNETISEPMCEK